MVFTRLVTLYIFLCLLYVEELKHIFSDNLNTLPLNYDNEFHVHRWSFFRSHLREIGSLNSGQYTKLERIRSKFIFWISFLKFKCQIWTVWNFRSNSNTSILAEFDHFRPTFGKIPSNSKFVWAYWWWLWLFTWV